jgi:hypothetical protein
MLAPSQQQFGRGVVLRSRMRPARRRPIRPSKLTRYISLIRPTSLTRSNAPMPTCFADGRQLGRRQHMADGRASESVYFRERAEDGGVAPLRRLPKIRSTRDGSIQSACFHARRAEVRRSAEAAGEQGALAKCTMVGYLSSHAASSGEAASCVRAIRISTESLSNVFYIHLRCHGCLG